MLANVLVPGLVLLGLSTGLLAWVWFTTGKYAKPSKEKRDD